MWFSLLGVLLETNEENTKITLPLPVVPDGILVVVDMQSQGFPLARSAMRGVKSEVEKAMANGWYIIVVEYDLDVAGHTDDDLLALLSGYDKWDTVKKVHEDGSQEVADFCRLHVPTSKRFRVCGVMTDICVAQTSFGLVGQMSDCTVEVVKSACACAFSRYDWNSFPAHERLTPVD